MKCSFSELKVAREHCCHKDGRCPLRPGSPKRLEAININSITPIEKRTHLVDDEIVLPIPQGGPIIAHELYKSEGKYFLRFVLSCNRDQ